MSTKNNRITRAISSVDVTIVADKKNKKTNRRLNDVIILLNRIPFI